MLKQMTACVTAAVIAALVATSAAAGATYGFTAVTDNSRHGAAIGKAQFSVEVIDRGPNIVEFLFQNSGPRASSMIQLYWDDMSGVLSSLNCWSTTTPGPWWSWRGVDFGGGTAHPGNLPGGDGVAFDADFSIQSDGYWSKTNNGVGRGEDVSVYFSYSGGFQDVIDSMDNGELVLGVHARGFEGGGSASYITAIGIPTPSAVFAGMALLGLLATRRSHRA